MSEKIIENNKLLARFMGEALRNLELDDENTGYHYHDSWDWLMPVVQRCKKLFPTFIGGMYLYSSVKDKLHRCDLVSTYNDVIEFVKGYNNKL